MIVHQNLQLSHLHTCGQFKIGQSEPSLPCHLACSLGKAHRMAEVLMSLPCILSTVHDHAAVVLHHPHKVLVRMVAAAQRPPDALRIGLLPQSDCIKRLLPQSAQE